MSRFTPTQLFMTHLTGKHVPLEAKPDTLQARAELILDARSWLVRLTGQDFGYDVSRWHEYLSSSQTPEDIRRGYTFEARHEHFEHWEPDTDWQLAVEEAKHLALEFPNCPRCGSFASLRKVSGPPSAKEVIWLCKVCEKRIPISSMNSDTVKTSNEE